MELNITYKIPLEPEWNSPILGIFLIAITLVTIFGNVLVICAVIKEINLKSVANYYIISLAIADLIVGLIVMPISALNKITNYYWFFGDILCDVWHSIDICASTASINSLLIIALDRYSAISDPISYHNRLLTRHWLLFVLLIWICSVFISFPAIAYWRWVTPIYLPNRCDFPNDLYYLVFSSLVSFYIPLPIMIFVYVRIYRAATRQMNALKTGQKLNCKTSDGKPLTLRIHRGGGGGGGGNGATVTNLNNNSKQTIQNKQHNKLSQFNKITKLSKSLEDLLILNNKKLKYNLYGSYSCLLNKNLNSGPSCTKGNIERKRRRRSYSLTEHIDIRHSDNKSISLNQLKQDHVKLTNILNNKKFNSNNHNNNNLLSSSSSSSLSFSSIKNFKIDYDDTKITKRKQLLKFYQNHYQGHENLLNQIKINSEKNTNMFLSLPNNKENEQNNNNNNDNKVLIKRCRRDSNLSNTSNFYFNLNDNELVKTITNTNSIATKVKRLTLAKKLKKFTKEQKAAKTLGIVMGVFILCWLPFFIYNVITGIFKANLSDSHEIIFFVFTWFGYLNSACNPIIYAFNSREFRRAFYKILFPSRFLNNKKRQNYYYSMQSSTTLNRDSKYNQTLVSRLRTTTINPSYKKIENIKTLCPFCKIYELVLINTRHAEDKSKSLKSLSTSLSSSSQEIQPVVVQRNKTENNNFSLNLRKKLNIFNTPTSTPISNQQQKNRFTSNSLKLRQTKSTKIYKTSHDITSGSFYSLKTNTQNNHKIALINNKNNKLITNNNNNNITRTTNTKLSPFKHSLSIQSMNSSTLKKKPGQIPVGTRYRFKTIKPQLVSTNNNEIKMFKDDLNDKLRCSNESSSYYECNEDDDYFDQINSNIMMKKKLELCNST